MIIHVVKSGESLYSISRLYKVPYQKIVKDNELTNPNQLVVGQTLVIMEGQRRHIVAPGQSLYSISRIYGINIDDLLKVNPNISRVTVLYPGQVIVIPEKPTKLGTIEVNGYAFPDINMDVLRKTLPYLTYLSIFSYEVKQDGSLTTINDAPIINIARNAKVAPIMVITNISEGSFSSDLAHTILTNDQLQNTLLNNVIEALKNKNYHGLDIDFEFIFPADRENYNNFLRKASTRLKSLGYTLATSLAPKTSNEQTGLLYEAHDYSVHGALVDHVIIMTYEWGYTFGEPMAVAPLNEVNKVISYAVTEIPSKKILMGIPNYGYDWTLPYIKGTAAKSLSINEAVDLARKEGAAIQFDLKSQSPFFYYYDDNKKMHIVWFEDARSIRAKLLLVNRYKLGGVSYWTINKYFPQNWLVLSSMYNIVKVL